MSSIARQLIAIWKSPRRQRLSAMMMLTGSGRGDRRFDIPFRGLKNCNCHAGVLSARRQLSLPEGKDMLPC